MPPSLRRRNRQHTPEVTQALSDSENEEVEADELVDDDDLPEEGDVEEEDEEDEEEIEEELEEQEEDAGSPTPSVETHSPIPPGFRDISALASWTVSSAKPGCSIPQLRHPSTSLFWQSDGPQPHHISIHFVKLVRIVGLRLYVDFKADESYTPTRIMFLAGSRPDDLVEWGEMRLEQPRGWVWADFSGVADPESEDEDEVDDGDGEDYEYEDDGDEDDDDDDGNDSDNDTPGHGDYTIEPGEQDAATLPTASRETHHNQRPRDPSARHSSNGENDTGAAGPSADAMMVDEDDSFLNHALTMQRRRLARLQQAATTARSRRQPRTPGTAQAHPVTPLPAWPTTSTPHPPNTSTTPATHTLLASSSSSPVLPAPTPRVPLDEHTSSPYSKTQVASFAADPTATTPRRRKKRRLPVLRAHLLQVRILENHQNGKDTHVRGLQIFAKEGRSEERKVEREAVGEGLTSGKGKAKGMAITETVTKGIRVLTRSPWDVEPMLR